MKDFIYEGNVKVIYGACQMDHVVEEIAKLGKKLLIVTTSSFVSGGHFEVLNNKLQNAGITTHCMSNIKLPLLSKVNEGIAICQNEQIEAVLGIGGGVCLDLAKAIAFGAVNTETPMEKYLTYQASTEGLSHLSVVTIPTNPMSGSETNPDIQITFDENGLQAGCTVGHAAFTWLNPEYVRSLPNHILAYGQMTVFAQLSCNYLNLSRSPLAEHYAEASIKTVLECLRNSLSDANDLDARGTLMLNSALSLSGINDLGREIEFVPYPLQSFAQRYLGLQYPQTMTVIFPYWMKAIYRASEDKEIFYRYFKEVLDLSVEGKDDEVLLQEALATVFALYREFGIPTCWKELAQDPKDHQKLVEIIDSFGPMPCKIMPATTEKLAEIIEDAIVGNVK